MSIASFRILWFNQVGSIYYQVHKCGTSSAGLPPPPPTLKRLLYALYSSQERMIQANWYIILTVSLFGTTNMFGGCADLPQTL